MTQQFRIPHSKAKVRVEPLDKTNLKNSSALIPGSTTPTQDLLAKSGISVDDQEREAMEQMIAQHFGVDVSEVSMKPRDPVQEVVDTALGVSPPPIPSSVAKLPASVKAKTTTADKVGRIAYTPTGFPRVSQDELMKDPGIQELLVMLGYMRPHGGKAEAAFIEKYISILPNVTVDKYGNRYVRVPMMTDKGPAEPDILFSCHTDTVHTQDGMQQICVGDARAFAENSSCLGADDCAGVWLCIQMIKAGVPGMYAFHRNEEHGGHGSEFAAKTFPKKLQKMKAAIAFDRKGYTDVITRQRGDTCCSYPFAISLGKILGGSFKPDPTGLFTDTANYTHLIGECTNISVGYHNAHGPMEWLDLSFIANLRDALILADWSKLEFSRPAAPRTPAYSAGSGYYGYGGARSYNRPDGGYNGGDSYDGAYGSPPAPAPVNGKGSLVIGGKKKNRRAKPKYDKHTTDMMRVYSEREARRARQTLGDLIDYCISFPETVAHFLAEEGYNTDSITEFYDDTMIVSASSWDAD